MNNSYHAFGLLLAQVWGEGVDNRVMRSAGQSASGLMLAADRHGHRHLLAPLPEQKAFQEQVGQTLTLTEWVHEQRRYLDLTCLSDSLAHVFASLADDVVRRVEEKGEEPSDALVAALTEWRSLFRPARTLDKDRARGLFGEIIVLKSLVQRSPQYALDLWSGPDKGQHDFTSTNGDVEVKTSGTEGLDVTVSSLHQLDPQPDRPLVLIRLQVEDSPNGKNITELADEVCRVGLVRSELTAKLGAAGFLLGSDPDPHRFRLITQTAWHVDADFPGLRASDLPSTRLHAIKKVRYTLDLVSAEPSLSPSELDTFLDRMVQT